MNRLSTRVIASLLLLVAFRSLALGWGTLGHQVTAVVAWNELPPGTRAKVETVLAQANDIYAGKSGMDGLQLAAVWPDIIKERVRQDPAQDEPLHIFSGLNVASAKDADHLHFADVDPQGHITSDHGKNAVFAIAFCRSALKSASSTPRQKGEALAYLAHLVGDVHQPLHAGNPADAGGNGIRNLRLPTYAPPMPRIPSDLHAVWDYFILETTRIDNAPQYYQQRLQTAVPARRQPALQVLVPDQWVLESHAMAMDKAYKQKNKIIKTGATLTKAYVDQALPIVDGRLMDGGIRLAELLKDALGQ